MNSFEKLKNEGIIMLDQIIPKELFVKIKNGFFEHDKLLFDDLNALHQNFLWLRHYFDVFY